MNIEIFEINKIEFVKITTSDKFEVVLSSLGASIFSVKYDDKFMTQSFSDVGKFMLPSNYHGKTIGRVCNRLKGNKIFIDNVEYIIKNNEGNNTLHGGKDGISTKIFDYKVRKNSNSVTVKFSYLSLDGESGFPGDMKINVFYKILKNIILIKFNAISNKTTMCSLTNHAYYCCGENSNNNLQLKILSSKFLHPNPSDLLPCDIRDVNKIMDFRKYKFIGKDINDDYLINSKSNGYDHYYYFDDINSKKKAISLKSSKYKIDFYTDFGGVQIYSDNYSSKKNEFSNSSKTRRLGIAIEPSESQKDIHILEANKEYNHFIRIKFSRI